MSSFDPSEHLIAGILHELEHEDERDVMVARLARSRQALQAGLVRTGIDELLRLEPAPTDPAPLAALRALLLAVCYCRRQQFEDAREWHGVALKLLQELTPPHHATSEAAHALLQLWMGFCVNAIRVANGALARHARRATDPQRTSLLLTLGAAYLRLGQIAKAEQCARALDSASDGHDLCLAHLLKGEIRLWSIVSQDAAFRSHVLLIDDAIRPPVTRAALIEEASRAYTRALDGAGSDLMAAREAMIGAAKMRLIAAPHSADWSRMEQHIDWLGQQGVAYARDLSRLHMGVLLLLNDRARDARRWLLPLADAVLQGHAQAFEYDALFFASEACRQSGADASGLHYLHLYNARIADQHLARGTVPPPSIDSGGANQPRSASRRRGDSDREMVDHVLECLRDAPDSMLDSDLMAQMAGVSRRTLENGFKRITGCAPKEFITRFRLREFDRRLGQAGPLVSAELELLARSVGFSSHRSLMRCAERLKEPIHR